MKNHIESIDYLRAVMSVFVVLWHLGGAGRSGLYTMGFAEHSITLTDVVNFYILLLAVPAFFFISFYLFAKAPKSPKMLFSRLSRFFILATFWMVTYIYIMNGGTQGLVIFYQYVAHSPLSAYVTIFNAGSSIYYFFPSLFILVLLAYAFHSAKNSILLIGLAISTLSLAVIPALTEATRSVLFGSYWSPLNFTPYVFLGILFANNQDALIRYKWKLLVGLSVGFAIAAVFEWNFSVGLMHFKIQNYAIPAYMRPSLVFAASMIGVVCLTSNIRSNFVIRFMAKYSLALFCLHPFFIGFAKRTVGNNGVVDNLIATALVVTICYVTAFILSKYLNKKVLF